MSEEEEAPKQEFTSDLLRNPCFTIGLGIIAMPGFLGMLFSDEPWGQTSLGLFFVFVLLMVTLPLATPFLIVGTIWTIIERMTS